MQGEGDVELKGCECHFSGITEGEGPSEKVEKSRSNSGIIALKHLTLTFGGLLLKESSSEHSHFPSQAPRGVPQIYCCARWREGSPWSNCGKLHRPGPQQFPGLNKTVVFDDLDTVKETAHYRGSRMPRSDLSVQSAFSILPPAVVVVLYFVQQL